LIPSTLSSSPSELPSGTLPWGSTTLVIQFLALGQQFVAHKLVVFHVVLGKESLWGYKRHSQRYALCLNSELTRSP
jgi:hypothetical protein